MTKEIKHTPLPWKMDGDGFDSVAARDFGTDGYCIFSVDDDGCYKDGICDLLNIVDDAESQANAEFIIRACNSHYELLEALKQVNHTLTIHGKVDGRSDLHKFVVSAIAKAEAA